MHHLHPSGVDQSAALWHLGQEILVDGCLGLIGQGHMERHILMFEEPCHRSHWFCSHLLDLVRRDVGIVCEALHAKALGQLVHCPRHRAEAVEGDLPIHQLEATGAIEVVASTDDHHPKNQLCHCVGVLARSVHGDHAFGFTCLQVDIVIASTSTDHDLQLIGLLQNSGIHDVTANDHGIHALYSCQQVVFALVILQLLQSVLRLLHYTFNLGNRPCCKGFLRGKENGPILSSFAGHGDLA
mmetsp:Transcript_4911/g.5482  ORF Transcript_4911/g.5482 Transcript_4911/m.5482 type:complete len:241 (+) Transcript_4911:402-1124(+)